MRITVLVSTRNRLKKLQRMLESLPASASGREVRPLVVCDGDEATYRTLPVGIATLLVPEWSGQTRCRNLALERIRGPVVYATDDIVFKPGAIEAAAAEMDRLFPAWDGVVGFTQEGNRFNPAGVALVGEPFIARYPGRHLFFDGYFHFAAQEVHRAASKLGLFSLSAKAVVYHYHPAHHREELDRTHQDARRWKTRDMALKSRREAAGLTWGISA
ncbi:MAG: hypothetical protein A2Y70_03050 [Candidatus Aminicenantes bacterium RBG_13_64_14]|nr:MAG: hypothetical protein A2Y70_03050 [Candidatus Aminicenantes bacterium RBG_13_64_14]